MGAGMHGFHGARLGQQHRFAEAVSAQHGDGIGGHAVDRSAAHGQFGTLVDIAVHLRYLVRRQAVDEFINREARLPVERAEALHHQVFREDLLHTRQHTDIPRAQVLLGRLHGVHFVPQLPAENGGMVAVTLAEDAHAAQELLLTTLRSDIIVGIGKRAAVRGMVRGFGVPLVHARPDMAETLDAELDLDAVPVGELQQAVDAHELGGVHLAVTGFDLEEVRIEPYAAEIGAVAVHLPEVMFHVGNRPHRGDVASHGDIRLPVRKAEITGIPGAYLDERAPEGAPGALGPRLRYRHEGKEAGQKDESFHRS